MLWQDTPAPLSQPPLPSTASLPTALVGTAGPPDTPSYCDFAQRHKHNMLFSPFMSWCSFSV